MNKFNELYESIMNEKYKGENDKGAELHIDKAFELIVREMGKSSVTPPSKQIPKMKKRILDELMKSGKGKKMNLKDTIKHTREKLDMYGFGY